MKLARRLEELPTYVFATIGQRVRALRGEGVDVIRLDIGSPDLPPPEPVVERLYRSTQDPRKHGYASFYGAPSFRAAIAEYYRCRFGVDLDPETQVLALIGSKEGIFHLPMAFVDPGTVVLAPDPGYPTYRNAVYLVGGELYRMPLAEENGWLPDLEAVPAGVLSRARVMWLNYPNNPTTAVAPLSFLERAVAFAREHQILLAYDNPYADVTWDGYTAPSILQVPGAMGVAVEFNSFSKAYNMAGWRVGMVVGNPESVAALARLKTNADTGIFQPIQDAAVVALGTDEGWLAQRNAAYRERRQVVTASLDRMGLSYTPSSATLYVWARLPEGVGSVDFASRLLEATGVSVSPGSAFGPHGEGYVRITLGHPVDRLAEAMERWEEWMG
ncbi:MAG TPA: aminotransferase class I/II-fold pyridoxal phosphate-dependent enzyme [Anaerolineae bacterium]|nr:aminotransferase class I/II-fold pyridoxal phosphate-dependent enzyme [Anaerolineae bacterium]